MKIRWHFSTDFKINLYAMRSICICSTSIVDQAPRRNCWHHSWAWTGVTMSCGTVDFLRSNLHSTENKTNERRTFQRKESNCYRLTGSEILWIECFIFSVIGIVQFRFKSNEYRQAERRRTMNQSMLLMIHLFVHSSLLHLPFFS